jgi:hypothetical protein
MRERRLFHEWQFLLWLSPKLQPDMLEVRVAGKTLLETTRLHDDHYDA